MGPEQVSSGHMAGAAAGLGSEAVGGGASGFDPGRLMNAVDNGADRLEKAAEALHDATVRFEHAEAAYERERQRQLLVIFDRAKRDGERMPAEDVRNALAHKDLDADIYAEYLEAKAAKEALGVRYRALAASVSARQSLLKALGGVGG